MTEIVAVLKPFAEWGILGTGWMLAIFFLLQLIKSQNLRISETTSMVEVNMKVAAALQRLTDAVKESA